MAPRRRRGEAGLTADRVRELYSKGAKAVAPQARNYWANKAFFEGEQWVWWDPARNRLDTFPVEEGRVRVHFNRYRSDAKILAAKLLRRPLAFEVPPTGADDASVHGARLGAGILHHVHREHDWETVREDHVWATLLGGTGLLCLEWDPAAGTSLGVNQLNNKPFGTGDVVTSALNVVEAACEPGTRHIERARWWIRASALPPEEVRDRYGLKDVPSADASAVLSPLQQRLLRAGGDEESPVELCLVLTYFERPSDHGDGQVLTVVGGSVVADPKPWPFPFKDRLNVVRVVETPSGGRWAGDTIFSDARSPQLAYNMSWSSIQEHMKLAGNARGYFEEGSIDEEDITDSPGDWIPIRAGSGVIPGYASPPAMPQWWIEQPERTARVLDDMLMVHEISRGGAPPGVDAGIALSLLAEQDDTPIGAMAKRFAEGWGRYASLVLKCYEAKVGPDEPRTARVDRAGSLPESVRWTGKALHGQTTAVVPLDVVATRSRAASYQLASSLKAMFPDMDLKLFATIADLPGAEDITEADDPDVAEARRENMMLALGDPVAPQRFQDHAKHIAELNRFRKSARFSELDGEVHELFELHAKAHEVLAAEEMARQLAKAAVSPALAAAAQGDEPPLAGDPVPAGPAVPHDAAMAEDPGAAPAEPAPI